MAKKCSWCGKTMKDGFLGNMANVSGFGLVTDIGNAATKHYCSKACEVAAKNADSGNAGAGAAIPSHVVVTHETKGPSFMSSMGGMFANVSEDAKNSQNELKTDVDEIANMKFSVDPEELQSQLTKLLTLHAKYNKGIGRSAEQKSVQQAAKDKLEFGIIKLKGMGKPDEVALMK